MRSLRSPGFLSPAKTILVPWKMTKNKKCGVSTWFLRQRTFCEKKHFSRHDGSICVCHRLHAPSATVCHDNAANFQSAFDPEWRRKHCTCTDFLEKQFNQFLTTIQSIQANLDIPSCTSLGSRGIQTRMYHPTQHHSSCWRRNTNNRRQDQTVVRRIRKDWDLACGLLPPQQCGTVNIWSWRSWLPSSLTWC